MDPCLVQTGEGVQRESRIKKPPRRPKEGWSLLVKPLKGRRKSKVAIGTCLDTPLS